jgi:glycosyltransferase involved in cell wall biosynthesis
MSGQHPTGTPTDRAPLSVIVLTFNEELNLAACLDSVAHWTRRVFVVDSGSTDATVAIARRHGAEVVAHRFGTHAEQWQWALATLPIETDWVLGLDADQSVTPYLAQQIATLLQSGTDAAGVFVSRRQIFRGKWIRFGGYYPKYLLKLFRRDRVSVDTDDLVDHHFSVTGPTLSLKGDLIEDNQNESEIAVWIAKHNRYAVLQAKQELAAGRERVGVSALFGNPDLRVRFLKQQWAALPLFVRPCLYVFYRYILRLGFLDGKQGFVFHVLQAFWYRLLVDINLDEMRAPRAATAAGMTGIEPRVEDETLLRGAPRS